MKKSKIYVASSWNNQFHATMVDVLMALGHQVFDYRHPTPDNNGFTWKEINGKDPMTWTVDEYVTALNDPRCIEAYTFDVKAMHWSDVCVLLMPCGNSNHAIAGWMKGQGKKVFIIQFTIEQPELMHMMFDGIITTVDDIQKVFAID